MTTRPGASNAVRKPRAPVALEDEAQHVNRNLLIAGALVFAALAIVWAIRSQGDPAVERDTRVALEATHDATWPAPTEAREGAVGSVSAPPGASPEAEQKFEQYVDDKYRGLFRDVAGARLDALRAALQERERMVVQINTAKQADDAEAREGVPQLEARKVELDRKVGTLLPPGELASFDALKDADIERFQVEDFTAGISNVAPLSAADKQAILTTKLAYRDRFKRVLADSRLMTGDLNGTERLLAYNEVSRALKEYQQSYLQEVRQYLYNDEQYALLTNYETTEYNAELAKLRAIAELD